MKIAIFNLHLLSFNKREKINNRICILFIYKNNVKVITTDINKKYDLDNLIFDYIVIKYEKKYGLLYDISEMKII